MNRRGASRREQELAAELEEWRRRGLQRTLAPPPAAIDFSSNDTLGLARHPAVREAAARALEHFGAGGRASRLLGGGCPVHAELEAEAARWLGAEASLLYPSGYQANLGVLAAVAGRGDAILSDALNHASIIDGARQSHAAVVVYPHRDPVALEEALRRCAWARRRIVVTESVFSMDGDAAPLEEMAAACARQQAWLVVDEAHAVGLLGPRGAGVVAGLQHLPEVQEALLARVVPGGKALGAGGALVAGSRLLCELLVHRSRPFVFTTAPSPVVAASLLAAIRLLEEQPELGAPVLRRARHLARQLDVACPAAAIVPWVVGEPAAALEAAELCATRGFDVRAVRPPTVPPGSSRLRLVVHRHNSDAEVEALAGVLGEWRRTRRANAPPAPVPAPPRVLCIAGTDTGVGKTVVSALCLRHAPRARYWKLVQTGDEDDTETVRRLSGGTVVPPAHRFPLPASPDQAAAAAGSSLDAEALRAAVLEEAARDPASLLVVELAGGLLVPYSESATQADLLQELARSGAVALRLWVVARSGLGTLNHTLLTLEALRARHLWPEALFLVGPPHAANRRTLQRAAGLAPLLEVPAFAPLDAAALDGWLARHPLPPGMP